MSADKQIKDILDKYDEDFASNTWVVPGGKARAILHKCIERIVAKAGIWFEAPQVVSTELDNLAIIVRGFMDVPKEDGNIRRLDEWSFGEASPRNNKNAYPWSMAEKRGKDRVALKLIGLHGLVYSEEEADDFKQQPASQSAKFGPSQETIAKALIMSLGSSRNEFDLKKWFTDNASVIEELPEALRDDVRTAYAAKMHTFKPRNAA